MSRKKKKAKTFGLVAAVSIPVLAAALAVAFQFAGSGGPAPRNRGFHTEPVPANPLVEISPVGDVEQSDLELISGAVARAFNLRTKIAGAVALPDAALDEARGQYSADWVLRVAVALKSEQAFRTLLVTSADIYSGDLPYVLYLGSPDSRMLLISTARLGGGGRLELPVEQVRARVRRLAVRGLAATLDISACDNDCILAGSLVPENLDRPPDYFCPQCARALQDKLDTGIGSPHAHFQASLLYLEDGSLDGAISELRKAIALKPDYVAAYLNLSELYIQKGWQAEAVTSLRKAADISPRDAEPRTRLAQLMLLNNQADAAIEELSLALAIDPDSREAHRLLGITYQLYLKDAERAGAHYRKFLELGGDPELIEDLLDFPGQKPDTEKKK